MYIPDIDYAISARILLKFLNFPLFQLENYSFCSDEILSTSCNNKGKAGSVIL